MRFPAVFTAIADVMMGYLVTHGDLRPYLHSGLLALSSGMTYLSGMVLNDYFDAAVDAMERPQRPIPSGRVAAASARKLGLGLFAGGFVVAIFTAAIAQDARPVLIAMFLACFVFAYDDRFKRTAIAPFLMGTCRLFNVLLGMSLAATADTMLPRAWTAAEWTIAAGIGIYIVGVTIFARSEERTSLRGQLATGIFVMVAGIATLAFGASHVGNHSNYRWIVWLMIAAYVVLRHSFAMMSADARTVQKSVRHALRMLIVLDFVVAFEAAPHSGGSMLILLLYVPMLALEYSFSTT
jgi:4-hydroxybenzoate polyprenyltransferase